VDTRILLKEVELTIVSVYEPVLTSLKFDCVHVEFNSGGERTILRMYIDHPDSVALDDCVAVSRQLEAVLDVEDIIEDAYTLEVSSPGLERPLGRRSDFERFTGQQAMVTTLNAEDGQQRWQGALMGIKDDEVLMHVDGQTIPIPFANVKRANLKYALGSQPRTQVSRGN